MMEYLNSPQFIDMLMLQFWGTIGFFISVLLQITKYYIRIQNNNGFSLGFWVKDNWSRCLLGFFLMIIAIRFPDISNWLMGSWLPDFMKNMHISKAAAVLIGFFNDKAADSLLNRKK